MHQHSRGTCIATGEASIEAKALSRPFLSFLLDLGVIATFAVAMLALIAMVNPALADGPANALVAERQIISAYP